MKKVLATLLIIGLIIGGNYLWENRDKKEVEPVSQEATFGATGTIRQEINILDSFLYSASGAYATSSERVNLDSTKYSGATYYFEVVASTTAGTNANIYLRNATSSVTYATILVDDGNTYTRTRSSSFTAPTGAPDLVVVTGNEAIGKGAIAARVVILQSADPLSNTQTQIEIGSATTTATNTTTLPLQYPKYWYYDSTKWDGTVTTYAEVTFQNTQFSSSTIYATAGTFTYITSPSTSAVVVEAWGAGGGGGVGTTGGGGGGGGGYARSTTTAAAGSSHTLVVAAGTASDSTTRNDSTYDTTTVVADGGAGSGTNAAGTGGTTNTGQVTRNGGAGGAADTGPDTSGGGGGAGGSVGVGSDGQGGQAAEGGDGGLANGGGGTQNNGGVSGNGAAGTTAATGGNGGGGSDTSTNGGNGGAPGGGGGGSDAGTGGTGAAGQIKITEINGGVSIALEEDDGNFGSWTFKAMIATTTRGVSTSSPTRLRSDSFTPTHGRNYRIVASTTNASATYSIYNAKIVVNQGTTPGDSYSESNRNATFTYGVGSSATSFGQTFTGTGSTIANSTFFLAKRAGVTGSMTSRIYAHTGTFGSTGVPTGAILASSDAIDISTLTTSLALVDFTFTGANQITLTNGTNYVVIVEITTSSSALAVDVGVDNSSPTHGGNFVDNDSGSWNAYSTIDAPFYINRTSVPPTKLQPQYLLANKIFQSGTNLQNFLTYWDSSEWNTTNAYVLQTEAADNSTSVVTLNEAAGTLVTNGTISSPDNRATSTSLCMPATGNLDTKATTNNGDIFAVRILVDVGGTEAVCGSVELISKPESFWDDE